MKETRETSIVPLVETTVELIPEPTARLVEKSFAENTIRNRQQALKQFQKVATGVTDL